MPSAEVIAKGLVDKIGLKGASIKHKRNDGAEFKVEGKSSTIKPVLSTCSVSLPIRFTAA